MVKIIMAKNYGICFGVKRAIGVLEKNKGIAYTLGPIIHNRQVVNEFKRKNIKPINYLSSRQKGHKLFIRAHGVPQTEIDTAVRKGYRVVDLTCPYVKRSQILAKELEKNGYKVVIIGQKNHPEIMAVASNLKSPLIVETPEDLKMVKKTEKIGVIYQTTLDTQLTKKLIPALKKKSKNIRICNTICQATKERQRAAVELAKKVDLVIVIGGKNSSNTNKLRAISEKYVLTYHVETASEIIKHWLIGKNLVGITAGASTPNSITKKVVDKIKYLTK